MSGASSTLRRPPRPYHRPRLSADYGTAIHTLIADYRDVLHPAELRELRRFAAKPTLMPLERSRLSVIARIALDRAAASEAPHAA